MQVAAVRTPSTAPRVAAAIIGAYRDLRGRDPPAKTSWLWPLALSANETRDWNAMFNSNIGNVTTSGNGNVNWYANPHVTEPYKYLAFDDERAGARSMLKTLDKFGGIDAADRGDQGAWQIALNKYLGISDYPPPWSIVARLQNVQPEGGFEVVSSPSLKGPALIIGAAALAMSAAAGYAAHRRREVFT